MCLEEKENRTKLIKLSHVQAYSKCSSHGVVLLVENPFKTKLGNRGYSTCLSIHLIFSHKSERGHFAHLRCLASLRDASSASGYF